MSIGPEVRQAVTLEQLAAYRKEYDWSDMAVTKPEVRNAYARWLPEMRQLSAELGRPTPDNTDAFWRFVELFGHALSTTVCLTFKLSEGACIVAAMLMAREHEMK